MDKTTDIENKTTEIARETILAPGVSEAVFDTFGPKDDEDRLSEMNLAALIASNAARVMRGERRMREGATPVSVITDCAEDVSGIGLREGAEDSARRRAAIVRLYVEGRLLDEPAAPLKAAADIASLRADESGELIQCFREGEDDDSLDMSDMAMPFPPQLLGEDDWLLPWRGLDEWARERGSESFAQIAVELDEVACAIVERE